MSCHTFPNRGPVGAPRATKEHMPFIGHRNVAQWGKNTALHRAMAYGLDPDSLKVREG